MIPGTQAINLLPYLEVKQGARCPKCNYCAGQINTLRGHVRAEHGEYRMGNTIPCSVSMQRFTPNHKYFEVQQSTQEVNQASQQILKRFDEEYIKGSNDSSLQFLHVDQEVESQWVRRTGWSQLFAGRDLKMLALNTHLGYLRGLGNGRLKKEQWHRLDDEFEDLWKQADYSWKSLPMTTIAKLREVRLTSDG
ncbi:hypothetical protein DFH27DRAFT_586652, partial [Peziza echinospora]